jgi:hypothetical protein
MIDSFSCLTLFYFEGFADRWWAFSQMKLAHPRFEKIEGLKFYKLLGSGGGDGFKPWPNWGVFAFLSHWDNRQVAEKAFAEEDLFCEFKKRTSKQKTFVLEPISGHGHWDGIMPFKDFYPENRDMPIAVLTRARIKWSWILLFWMKVPAVRKSMRESPNLIQAIGVGELPLIEQATFSVWKDLESLNQYAYSKGKHKEAIVQTRKVKWYSEEMFIRFNLLETIEGFPS